MDERRDWAIKRGYLRSPFPAVEDGLPVRAKMSSAMEHIDDVYETPVINDHEFTPRVADPYRCGHIVNGNWNSSTADVDYCNALADCHVRPHETGLTGTSWMSSFLSVVAPGFVWVVLCIIATAILFGVTKW